MAGLWAGFIGRSSTACSEGHPSLRELGPSHCHKLTEGIVKEFAGFPSLGVLYVTGIDFTEAGLSELGKIEKLVSLSLAPCNSLQPTGLSIGDEEVGMIANLINLKLLEFKECPGISDESVALLSRLTALEMLNLEKRGSPNRASLHSN